MAKLTRKQLASLNSIRVNLQRAMDYIYSEQTLVCAKRSAATTTLDFTRKADGVVCCEMEKEYGSHLCGLRDAMKRLNDFEKMNT